MKVNEFNYPYIYYIYLYFFLDVSEYTNDIVAYLLKAITVEPEKQPLLENGSGTTFVARQHIHDKRQLNKQQRNGVFCAVLAELL
jgi:hypothetical protein